MLSLFENKFSREMSRVSWTDRRGNQSLNEELGVTSGTMLNFVKTNTYIVWDTLKYIKN